MPTQTVPAFDVDVPGGRLHVYDFSGGEVDADAPLLVLVHGITANGRAWDSVAAAVRQRRGVGRTRIWAPDLRGRGGSGTVGEPYGLGAHVDDLLTLADRAGAEPFVLAGHSMGAFVGALAGGRHPQRLAGLALLDGGFSFPTPEDLDIDAALQAVIGPAMSRLSMTFADEQAYLDFWAQHPAVGPVLQGPIAEAMRSYLLADLRPGRDGLCSSCHIEAIRADGADVLADQETHAGARKAVQAGVPVEFVWAERGLMNEPTGLYDEDRIAALALPEAVRVIGVDDINHYTLVFDPEGVEPVTDSIVRLLGD